MYTVLGVSSENVGRGVSIRAAALSPYKICSNVTRTLCLAVREVSIDSWSKGSKILLMCLQLSVRPLGKCF